MRQQFIVIIALLLIHVSWTVRLGNPIVTKAIATIRGGARKPSKPSSKRVDIKKSRTKRHVEEEDEDDDDDDDFDSKPSKRRSGSYKKLSTKGKKRSAPRGAMQMIPWGSKSAPTKKGSTIRDRLEAIAKTGQSAYKDVYRRAKVLRSSAFEGMLLKATWPGDTVVPRATLDEIIKHSIPAFKYGRSDSDDDPYYMTMHKLWTKMSEADWRTVSKSLYILHAISRESSVDACESFATAIKDMIKIQNPKKPNHRYFDSKLIAMLDEKSAAYKPFVKAYATYVLFRTKNFSAKFEELSELEAEAMPGKKSLALVKKAQKLLLMGVDCATADKKQANVITGQISKLLVQDLRDLYKLYAVELNKLVQNCELLKDDQELVAVLKAHAALEEKLKKFLTHTAKLFAKLKVKLPSDLGDVAAVTSNSVEATVAKLTSISGGFKRGKAVTKRVAASLDDEEDDLDDEEADEDDADDEDEEQDNADAEEEEGSEMDDELESIENDDEDSDQLPKADDDDDDAEDEDDADEEGEVEESDDEIEEKQEEESNGADEGDADEDDDDDDDDDEDVADIEDDEEEEDEDDQ